MKQVIWFLKDLLNIKIQKNQGVLILSSCITGFIFCYTGAKIQKEIITELPAEFLSIQSLWFCISTLLVGIIWKGTTRHFAIKYFSLLAISESILAFSLGMYLTFIQYNAWVFAIGTLLYQSVISNFVCKCLMCFESKLWQEREREDFDNTNSVIRNIISCLGFAISIMKMPSLKVAIFLWGCSCILDDIGWIIVYKRNRDIILQNEKE